LQRRINSYVKLLLELPFIILNSSTRKWPGDPLECRPWEIPIFEILADHYPGFKEVVQGTHGLPSLIKAFQTLGAKSKLSADEQIIYGRCLQYMTMLAKPYIKSIAQVEGIVASLLDPIAYVSWSCYS